MQNEATVKAVVTEVLPNSLYRVKLENEKEIIAYLAGKLKMHHIRVMTGDTVSLILSPEGEKGRIVYRN